MSQTIYELTQQQQELLDTLFFDDENEELLLQQIAQIKGTVEHKLEYLSKILMEAKAVEASREDALARAETRYIQSTCATQRLKEFMRESMINFDIKRIKTDDCTVSIQKGRESVFVPEGFDAKGLPENLRTHYPERFEPKKTDIKKLLNAGDCIEGLSLIRGEDIMVVR